MINTVKMDIYRMLKSKCFYVISIIYIVMLSFEFIFFKVGYALNKGVNHFDKLVQTQCSSEDLVFFIGIFTSVFISTEIKTGFVKNVIGSVKNRVYLILSKCIVSTILTILLLGVTILLDIIFGKILIPDFKIFISGNLFLMIFEFLLLMMGYISLINMSVILLKKNYIGIISIFLFQGKLIENILRLFQGTFGIKLDNLSKFLLEKNIYSIKLVNSSFDIVRIVLVSIFAIIMYNLISCKVFQKRDIR